MVKCRYSLYRNHLRGVSGISVIHTKLYLTSNFSDRMTFIYRPSRKYFSEIPLPLKSSVQGRWSCIRRLRRLSKCSIFIHSITFFLVLWSVGVTSTVNMTTVKGGKCLFLHHQLYKVNGPSEISVDFDEDVCLQTKKTQIFVDWQKMKGQKNRKKRKTRKKLRQKLLWFLHCVLCL